MKLGNVIILNKWGSFGRNCFLSKENRISICSNPSKINLLNVSYENLFKLRTNSSAWSIKKLKYFIENSKYEKLSIIPFVPLEYTYVSEFKKIQFIQNDYKQYLHCESKESLKKILENCNIKNENIVKYYNLKTSLNYDEIVQYLGKPFFVQSDSMGGQGTKLIKNKKEFSDLNYKCIKRISEFVEGDVFNFNVLNAPIDQENCIVLVEVPSYKPMHIKNLYGLEYSSSGNEWGTKFINPISKIIKDIVKIGNYIYKNMNIRGIWGVDVIVHGNEYKIIEINTRLQGTTEVMSALQVLRKSIPFLYLHCSIFTNNCIPNMDAVNYNKNTSIFTNSLTSKSLYYMKIKMNKDIYFHPSEKFKGDGIYTLSDDVLLKTSSSIKTYNANLDFNQVLICNTPPIGTKVEEGQEIAMVEGVKNKSTIIFKNNCNLSKKGEEILEKVKQLFNL